jgi:hypothetical protein
MAGTIKAVTESTKTCFIIMPISTTEGMLTQYKDDTDHFQHVLDHLFIPAIEKAGLKPIPPKSKGSELIHGDIVKNIETSDLVLCDMSTLNANVFFELGIRTSLNKPACLVKDNLTVKVPFDTGIVNYHTYSSALNPWELKKEIENLTSHITDTLTKSVGKNALWKYFGLSVVAKETDQKGGVEDKLQYLSLQIEGLRKQQEKVVTYGEIHPTLAERMKRKADDEMSDKIGQILAAKGIGFGGLLYSGNELQVHTLNEIDLEVKEVLEKLVARYGYSRLYFKYPGQKGKEWM